MRRIPRGVLPLAVVLAVVAACVGTLPWTAWSGGEPRYAAGETVWARMAPWWAPGREDAADRVLRDRGLPEAVRREIAARHGGGVEAVEGSEDPAVRAELDGARPAFWLGSDLLGRSVLVRLLAGGAVSLLVGLGAALIAVGIGVAYGMIAGYAGGRTDSVMMRIVDVLYGLPTVLLVVLLAIASDAAIDRYVNRDGERRAWVRAESARSAAGPAELEARASAMFPPRALPAPRTAIELGTLFVAIGGVGWLTMARVVRGQVLSLKARPFVEAARTIGASPARIFGRHLLPNLMGPILVYATLLVPQAMLQESFLSFLGLGVKAPLPSWGTLCAEGLPELNPYRSHWWLLAFPCVMLGGTLLTLNFVGEAVRERMDPKGKGR